jgi:hypothetical protein
VRGVLGRLLEDNYNFSIELRREMEMRTKDELKLILSGRPANENDNESNRDISLETRDRIKRFIAWLTYCYHAIDFKKRRARIPEYVKQKKASFPGYFSQRWKNPKKFKSTKKQLATHTRSPRCEYSASSKELFL